jgi:hypothetical protein
MQAFWSHGGGTHESQHSVAYRDRCIGLLRPTSVTTARGTSAITGLLWNVDRNSVETGTRNMVRRSKKRFQFGFAMMLAKVAEMNDGS